MTGQRRPAGDLVQIAGRKIAADVSGNISSIALDFSVGQVAELTISVLDPTGRLDDTPLADMGATVTVSGIPGRWEIGAIDANYGAGITWTYRARSALARQLRKTYKVGAEREVSPTDWVTRRVKELGGVAITQKSSKRATITQAGNEDKQSSLDVMSSLAGELEWEWLEVGGTFYFGDPHWAFKGGAKTPTWPVTWKKSPATDALAMSAVVSDDDTEVSGTLELSLPYLAGSRIRPWHRLRVTGIGRFSGDWLVGGVSYPLDRVSDVAVRCNRPRKPRNKGGSAS